MSTIFFLQSDNEETTAEAIALIARVYGKAHSAAEEVSAISAYLTSPSAATFTGRLGGTVVATISVIGDSEKGLPMDSIYRAELDALRKEGGRLAEVGQFAVDREQLAEQLPTFPPLAVTTNLFKLVLKHSISEQIDRLCIAINPKHAAFYQGLGFVQIGALKHYPSVANAPALAFALDVDSLADRMKNGGEKNALLIELFREISGKPPAPTL